MTAAGQAHDLSTTKAWALAYIRLGWWVLPLDPGSKKPLGRLVPNGFHDATNDPEVAARWWTARPDAGIGIALKASGLVAVDIDPRNGGLFTMERLEAEHGPLQSDVVALTGGGGEHLVFASQLVEGLPGKLGPGVDLKADGYIAVEPTLHPSGKAYAWEASSDPLHGAVPTTLPGWIRDLARQPLHVPDGGWTTSLHPIDPARLASVREALPWVDAGPRDAWLQVGMAIHNEMPGPDGFDLWCEWSQRSPKFDPQDQLRVWRSFHVKGLQGVGLNSIFAQAQAAGWRNAGSAAPLPPADDGLLLDVLALDARSAATRWAVKGMVPDVSLGMVFGASGTFKSFIALDYQLHRAWSLAWCGRRTAPGVPVFIAAEGGTGLIRRIKAWHLARGLDWRLCTLRVVVVPLLLLRQAPVLADAIVKAGVQPCDITIDTLSQTFDGNENAADEIASYLRALRVHLVERFGCGVTVIHHSGHGATERPRGSSAIQANVDWLMGVFRQGDDSMVSTVECLKVKDGEKFKPVDFVLQAFELGMDEDGDPITSLAASFVDSAAAILKADDGKREGHRALLLRLAGALVDEREVRKAFDRELEDQPDGTRRSAWKRAVEWAVSSGMLRRINGRLEVLTGVAEAQS